MPWIALIFGILGILVGLGGLGILTLFSPLAVFGGAEGVASYGSGFVATAFYLVSSVMLLMSYQGLKARKMSGWTMLFWSETIYFVGQVVSFALFNAIIAALIGYYLLFQIKSHYK